ncbi:MAG: sigma-70 family RNA polymerase sigma factor [Ruminococcus sp.]|nr:sigma-70 family RNA polymerase sigma factor [Ruminococcus sp.]
MDAEECEKMIRRYYQEIYNYCFGRLGCDKHSAEDCTQDVFVVFYSKHEKLDPDSIRIWLYRTADNCIKTAARQMNTEQISIEDSKEAQNASSDIFGVENSSSPLDRLDEDERRIIETYYSTEYGSRTEAAKKLGMSLPALYQRIHKIKNKLKKSE